MSQNEAPQQILITGASGGIGQALARHYAAPGRTLWLHGRNESRLDTIVATCRAAGADAQPLRHSLDRAHLNAWRQTLADLGPVDLVIVNAGRSSNIGDGRDGEAWNDVQSVIDINLSAALATVDAVLPTMRARRRGQIALISSVSAWYGLPLTPAYCATKAGLKAYGEALRGWLAGEGIAVNVVLPGFVSSDMSARFPGPKPFMMRADQAALRIANGLARNQGRIAFPLPLALGMWALAALPAPISQWILQRLGFGVRPDGKRP